MKANANKSNRSDGKKSSSPSVNHRRESKKHANHGSRENSNSRRAFSKSIKYLNKLTVFQLILCNAFFIWFLVLWSSYLVGRYCITVFLVNFTQSNPSRVQITLHIIFFHFYWVNCVKSRLKITWYLTINKSSNISRKTKGHQTASSSQQSTTRKTWEQSGI